MKFIIVDDSDIFRENMKDYLEKTLNHEVIASVPGGEEFLELNNIHSADIILMDVEMKGISGIDTAQQILETMPYLKIIAVTMYYDSVFLLQLIETGFKGCIFKDDIFETSKQAFIDVALGKTYFNPKIKLKKKGATSLLS